MRSTMLWLVLAAASTGCAGTKTIQPRGEDIIVIDYPADRRGAYLLKRADGRYDLVVEPSPDVAKEVLADLGLTAETIGSLTSPQLKANYAEKVVDLARRSQTLQVLRESLFRLSEMAMSDEITPEDRVRLFTDVLETIKIIAATEFAGSGADAATIKALIDQTFSDVEEGVIPPPDGQE